MTDIPDRVLVRASMRFPVSYACTFSREGNRFFWICGHCGKGRFAPVPHLGDECPDCHFLVVEVVMLTTEMLERHRAEWAAKNEYMRTFGRPEA